MKTFCALDTGLKATMWGGGAAAGTSYMRIVLVNSGMDACVMQGTPGAQPVTGRSHQPVGPSSMKPIPQLGRGGRVTLAPKGGSADVVYGMETAVNWPKQKCEPRASNGVMLHFEGVRAFFVADFAKGGSPDWLVCELLQSTSIYGLKAGTSKL